MLELKDDHQWQSKEGYKIFVADRGAVRFDVPRDWVLEPDETSFKFFDKAPPDEDACLEFSYNRLPPGADFKDFPLAAILKKVVKEDDRDVIETGEIVKLKRQTARIVWIELKFIDRQDEPCEAYSRICIGLGSDIQALLTFDYWADQAELMQPIWDVVIDSLTLGLYIRDPRTGYAFPD